MSRCAFALKRHLTVCDNPFGMFNILESLHRAQPSKACHGDFRIVGKRLVSFSVW
jgi:hypothetical protein